MIHYGSSLCTNPCFPNSKKEKPEENANDAKSRKPYNQTSNKPEESSGNEQKAIMCFNSDHEDSIINHSNDLIDFTRDLVTVPTEAEPTNQIPKPAVIRVCYTST